MTHSEAIGSRVRELREKRNMTQAELAAEIGSTQSALSRLENGGATNLTMETLQGIAEGLGVELRVLLVEA